MWSASASFLAHNSSSEENDCEKEKLFHSKAKVLGSVAVTDCSWGLILSLLSYGRVPLKLMENNLGIGMYMDWVRTSHNYQKSRQRGLLKMIFWHVSVQFRIPATSSRCRGLCSVCDMTVEETLLGQEWRVNVLVLLQMSLFRKIVVLDEFSRYGIHTKPQRP